jgi:hypothetical protein
MQRLERLLVTIHGLFGLAVVHDLAFNKLLLLMSRLPNLDTRNLLPSISGHLKCRKHMLCRKKEHGDK